MSVPTGTPGDEVPTEDWADQATEAGPVAESLAAPASVSPASREADEADLVEQELPVDLSDDEQ